MNEHQRILSLITEIRNSHSVMQDVFMNGSCINLFCILRVVYPKAEAYYNINHIITKIGERFYDINGEVSGEGYERFTECYKKERVNRAFKQMYESEMEI